MWIFLSIFYRVYHPTLVGGLEHGFYDFPFSWECHPSQLTNSYFSEGLAATTSQP
jgi:hypothetical protein